MLKNYFRVLKHGKKPQFKRHFFTTTTTTTGTRKLSNDSSTTSNGTLRIKVENSPQICYAYSTRGIRRSNEDRFQKITLRLGKTDALYSGIFDGHGGEEASDFCAKEMHKIYKNVFHDLEAEYKHAKSKISPRKLQVMLTERSMTEAFRRTDQEFLREYGAVSQSGSTASIAIIQPVEGVTDQEHPNQVLLTIGHVGDTRIILCDNISGRSQTLTIDHKPWEPMEKERIEKNGGIVLTDSFGQKAVMGVLAVSRAIGVSKLKKASKVVISEPFLMSRVLDEKDAFLVMVSDGITGVMSDQEIVDIVKGCIDPQSASQALVEVAERYSTNDNATALVIRLQGWPLQKKPPKTKDFTQNLRRFKLKHSNYGQRTGGIGFLLEDEIEEDGIDEIPAERFIVDLFDAVGRDIGGTDIFTEETSGISKGQHYTLLDKGTAVKIGRVSKQELLDGITALGVSFRLAQDEEDHVSVSADYLVNLLFENLKIPTSSDEIGSLKIQPSFTEEVRSSHPHLLEILQSTTSAKKLSTEPARQSLSAADIIRTIKKNRVKILVYRHNKADGI